MQSKRLRKKGLQPKKRYFTGGTVECPNPPCPPNPTITQPVSPELDVTGLPSDQGVIKPQQAGIPPNAAWMYQAMPSFQNPEGMQAAAKWTEENPLSSPQGLNLMGMLNSMGMKALALPVPGTAHIAGGLAVGDVFNAYLLKEGVEGFQRDIPEFFDNPSFEGLKNLGIDALQVLPGSLGLYSNVVKPAADIIRSGRSYFAGEKAAQTLDVPFQNVDHLVDPVKMALDQLKRTVRKPMSIVKDPVPVPIMKEARMEASIQGLRDRFNIGTGRVVDGKAMTPQLLREMAIKELIGESTDAGRIARANQLIDKAIEDAMPKAIETVMRRSEGNLLDIPVDTRRPELDRVRMRFLGPNSKLWQQANKDGLIPVRNLNQSMKDMSEMEKYVFEEAVFRAPVYNKKGVLLTGKELTDAKNAIISAVGRRGVGPSIEESAEGIGDISGYKINLNQLKGLSEETTATRSPIRTFEIAEGQKDVFGSKIDQVKKSTRMFSGSNYSDYGLGRIGYGSLDSESSKTWAIGSDVIRSNTNHFGRGELAHFRTFVNDGPTELTDNIPGTEVGFHGAAAGLRSGTSISGSSSGAGGGRIEWYPDMSRVPSGMGVTGRGGTLVFFDGGPARSLEDAISSDMVRSSPVAYLSEINNFNNSMARSGNETRRIITEINSIQVNGEPLVKNDFKIKNLYDFASDPNRRAAVDALLIPDSMKDLINSNFDQLINFGKLEEAAMGSLKANTNLIASPVKNLDAQKVFKESRNLLDVMAFNRHGDGNYFHKINQANYKTITEIAEGDFSFGSWSTAGGGEDLAYLLNRNNEHTLPRVREQAMDLFDDQKKAIQKIIENTPGLSGADAVISETFNSVASQGVKKISDLRDTSQDIFNEIERYSSEAEDIAYDLSEAYNNTLGNLRRELGGGNAMFGGGDALQQQ